MIENYLNLAAELFSKYAKTAFLDTFNFWTTYYVQACECGLVVLFCCFLYSLIMHKKFRAYNLIFTFLFGAYCYYIFAIAFMSREAGAFQKVNLVPFDTIKNIYSRKFALENLFMMMPLGLLLPAVAKVGRKPAVGLLSGFALAAVIEIAQLITGRGYFEIDDIIFNGLGEVVGWLIAMLIYGIILIFKHFARPLRKRRRK